MCTWKDAKAYSYYRCRFLFTVTLKNQRVWVFFLSHVNSPRVIFFKLSGDFINWADIHTTFTALTCHDSLNTISLPGDRSELKQNMQGGNNCLFPSVNWHYSTNSGRMRAREGLHECGSIAQQRLWRGEADPRSRPLRTAAVSQQDQFHSVRSSAAFLSYSSTCQKFIWIKLKVSWIWLPHPTLPTAL